MNFMFSLQKGINYCCYWFLLLLLFISFQIFLSNSLFKSKFQKSKNKNSTCYLNGKRNLDELFIKLWYSVALLEEFFLYLRLTFETKRNQFLNHPNIPYTRAVLKLLDSKLAYWTFVSKAFQTWPTNSNYNLQKRSTY